MEFDAGRPIDWGRTSADYSRFRPGPPQSLYEKLSVHGVGLPGQKMLDLGTGTGVLAREFGRRGCEICGIDVSAGQIAAAQALAREEGLGIDFRVAPAEETGSQDATFDVVTASQCWLYFDLMRVLPEVRRILRPRGLLMVSHFSWLPRLDPVAKATEDLVLKFNPDWTGADWDGRVPARPGWSRDVLELRAMFYYDDGVRFTRESWRGRVRALRGIGATLSEEQVRAFDREHAKLLEEIADEEFSIRHRIDAHIFAFGDEPLS